MENKDRNLCHETGCPDLCCRNMTFISHQGDENMLEAREISPDEDLRDLPRGVYKSDLFDGVETIYLRGLCPRNGENGCHGPKMDACRNFEFGGNNCNKLRSKNGLAEVNPDGTFKPTIKHRLKTLFTPSIT